MRLAIMQPYLFPYIGYYQLIHHADAFVIYDDVNYINKGWINRNKILHNAQEFLFTLPLNKVSQNKKINEIDINKPDSNKKKILRIIEHAYARAPNFSLAFPLLEQLLLMNENNLSKYIEQTLKATSEFLGINTSFFLSSNIQKDNMLTGQDKILEICKQLNANEYINPIGGNALYSKEVFKQNGINLYFIKPLEIKYNQFGGTFVPWLSIIDHMMFLGKNEIKNMLDQYELL